MNKEIQQILLVEDDVEYTGLAQRALAASSDRYHIEVVRKLAAARMRLRQRLPDVLVTDLRLPDGNGLDLVKQYASSSCFPVVVVTNQGENAEAIEAMRAGAIDYFSKSASLYENICGASRSNSAGVELFHAKASFGDCAFAE